MVEAPPDTDTEDTFKQRIWRIIFLSDTPAGKRFDVVLLWFIGLSVLAVMAESVRAIGDRYAGWLWGAEVVFTVVFTFEYFVRIWSVRRKRRYIFSFFGIVDLLSILPFYITLFITGTAHQLAVIRIVRMLRVFRVLKMARHMGEAAVLLGALRASRTKITVFLFGILSITLILGTVLYLIEPPEAGFTSIPKSVYWAVVTLTTVGYGDIVPSTPIGQFVAAAIMLLGYAVLAVPTGIFAAELVGETHRQGMENMQGLLHSHGVSLGGQVKGGQGDSQNPDGVQAVEVPLLIQPFRCAECGANGHRPTAQHCFSCGAPLRDDPQQELPIWSHSEGAEKADGPGEEDSR